METDTCTIPKLMSAAIAAHLITAAVFLHLTGCLTVLMLVLQKFLESKLTNGIKLVLKTTSILRQPRRTLFNASQLRSTWAQAALLNSSNIRTKQPSPQKLIPQFSCSPVLVRRL